MTMLQLFGVILAAYLAGRTICWFSGCVKSAVVFTILERHPGLRKLLNEQHVKRQTVKNKVWPN